jgi:O-antigen/teichoic acid export membrane protein
VAEVSLRALVRNALYVNAGELWRIASRLVLTPIILTKIGLEGYGTWALLLGLCSYVTMLNMSFSTAYTKLTAELEQRGDYERLSEALGAGMVVIGSVGLAGLAGVWVIAPWVLPWLQVPPELVGGAHQALLIVCLGVALDMSVGCALHVLVGLQRIDQRTRLNVAGSIVDFGITLPLLYAGFGLMALAVGFLCGRALAVGAAWLLVRRNCPALALSPFQMSRSGLRSVLSLGLRFQALGLLNTAVREAIRMLISALCGVSLLGAYHLASRLLSLATTPASSIIAPLLPAFAHLDASRDVARWQTLFFSASKALAAAAVVALGFTALFADPLLFAWTGRHIPEAAFTVRVMAVANFVRLLTGVGTAALRAAGTVRLEFAYGVVGSTASVLGIAVGYRLAGFTGVVTALGAAVVIAGSWFLWRFTRTRSLSIRSYVGSSLLLPAALLAPVIVGVSFASTALPLLAFDSPDRWTVLLSLMVAAGASAAACAPVGWSWILSPAERAALRGLVPVRSSSTATLG